MFKSSFKKKVFPQVFKKAEGNNQPLQECQQDSNQGFGLQYILKQQERGIDSQPIQHYDQDSNKSIPLYYMPKPSVGDNPFIPDNWSIRDFQIGRHIGKGKYGHVYLARERRSKHIVALKVLSKKQLINCDVINQLRRQIEIHTHVHHENILKMFGFFFDQKRVYIILEYAPGGELYALFKQVGRFQQSIVATYVKQIISAMQYLHQQKVIHRDLKPQNILLSTDRIVKLSDFGWAVHTSNTRKTFCGTIDYICPEIINRLEYDGQLDLWTIGVLAFELSSGGAPFESASRQQTSKKIRNLDYTIPAYFSVQLKDFVSRLLVSDPSKRMRQSQAMNHPWIIKYSKI